MSLNSSDFLRAIQTLSTLKYSSSIQLLRNNDLEIPYKLIWSNDARKTEMAPTTTSAKFPVRLQSALFDSTMISMTFLVV